MLWIGLTGGIGTGKSTVGRMLTARGFLVVSADLLAHQVLDRDEDVQKSIFSAFGPGVRSRAGKVDREALAKIVFADPSRRRLLEGWVHPKVRALVQALRQKAEAEGRKVAFYEVPLLFEQGLEGEFDAVLVVASSRGQQIERLLRLRGLSRADAEARISAQLPSEEKVKRAQYVIHNLGGVEELQKAVDQILQSLGISYQAQE